VNAHLTAAEAGYILFNSNARAIVGSAQQAATLSAHGTHLRAGLPGLRVVADSDLDGWRRYPECVSHQPSHRSPTKPKAIYSQYSSGTTGQPKESGVSAPASRRPKRPTRSAALRGDGMESDPVYASPAPLDHTAPAMWSLCAGWRHHHGRAGEVRTRRVPGRDRPPSGDPRQFVPSMFVRMLNCRGISGIAYDTSSLRLVIHAAAPCPVPIKSAMIDWWEPIVEESYSSALEGAEIISITAEDWRSHPGSGGARAVGCGAHQR
jgi:long-chain acyl-CoA synthetase